MAEMMQTQAGDAGAFERFDFARVPSLALSSMKKPSNAICKFWPM